VTVRNLSVSGEFLRTVMEYVTTIPCAKEYTAVMREVSPPSSFATLTPPGTASRSCARSPGEPPGAAGLYKENPPD